jgi:hypothetical protein
MTALDRELVSLAGGFHPFSPPGPCPPPSRGGADAQLHPSPPPGAGRHASPIRSRPAPRSSSDFSKEATRQARGAPVLQTAEDGESDPPPIAVGSNRLIPLPLRPQAIGAGIRDRSLADHPIWRRSWPPNVSSRSTAWRRSSQPRRPLYVRSHPIRNSPMAARQKHHQSRIRIEERG